MGIFTVFFNDLFKVHILNPILDFLGKMDQRIEDYRVESMKTAISRTHTVAQLDRLWNTTSAHIRENKEVAQYKTDKRAELKAQGFHTEVDIAMGWLGTQVANAIWGVTDRALPKIQGWIDQFGDAYHLKTEEREALKSLSETGEFGLNAVVSFLLGATAMPVIMAGGEPLWQDIRMKAYQAYPSSIADATTAVRLKYLEKITDADYGEIMGKWGFNDKQKTHLENAYLFYPTPSDFIRFAVRETFKPEVVDRFGLDTGYPAEMEPYVIKAGMSPEWLKHYWRAHWVNISPRMAFEMLHRDQITVDDVRTILKIADYPPAFIDPLIEIAYKPFTRVDVRRMYQAGVLQEADVLRSYQDIGYDLEKATTMAEWTVAQATEKDRDLTKGELLAAYRIGTFTAGEMLSRLMAMGYNYEEAVFYIAFEEHKRVQEIAEDTEDLYHIQALNGVISIEEYQKGLEGLQLRDGEIQYYVERMKRRLRKRVKTSSAGTLRRWLKAGLLTEELFMEKMINLGYPSDEVELYRKEIIGK